RYGDSWETAVSVGSTKTTTYVATVDWGGVRRFWVAAIDVAQNYGVPVSVDVAIESPGPVGGLVASVIDNNVLFRYQAPTTGTLPATFATMFEDQSGTYVYWIAAVDTAGNVGEPQSTQAQVDQPPDYIVRSNIAFDLGDPLAADNVFVALRNGVEVLIAPVDP